MPLEIRHRLPPLEALTAIRFFAAMYVVLFHLDLRNHMSRPSDWPLLLNFASTGYTAVTLAFVLSGFILAYNYPTVSSRKDFWIARFARVYPLFFLCCCFAIARPSEWHMHPLLPRALISFLLLQGLWPPLFGALNQYGWAISVQAFFYLLFPFLLPLLTRIRSKAFLASQVVALFLACIPIVLAMNHHPLSAAWAVNMLELHFAPVRINTFIVGIYFGVRYRQSAVSPDYAAADWNRRGGWQTLAATLSSALLLIAPLPYFLTPLRTYFLTYTYALLILGLAKVTWAVFKSRLMQTAGDMSYSIYILQFPVFFAYAATCWHFFPGITPTPWGCVALLLVAAYASSRWFEMPARLAIRRLLTAKPVPTLST